MAIPDNSSAIGENSRFRRNNRNHHNHSQNQHQPISETDPIPSIIISNRSKSSISSLLFSTFNTPTINETHKKKNFSSSTFRGLGCAASSQVSVPAIIRSSADWESKKVKKKKKKNKGPAIVALGGETTRNGSNLNNNNNQASSSSSSSSALSSLALSSSCVAAVPDVAWCGPGIGLTTDAASVDYVASRRPLSGSRGKVDVEKMSHRERPSCPARRLVTQEEIPFLDSEAASGRSHPRFDAVGSRSHRQARHGFPEGLAEIVMLQSSLLMGGRLDALDRYRDWRLDIDDMTYEDLLELGDQIGYVSTGLKDYQIARSLRKFKLSFLDLSEKDKKCSICQEEYEADDEMGKLKCGHFYHFQCIKQWLEQKNACPICKTAAVSQSQSK